VIVFEPGRSSHAKSSQALQVSPEKTSIKEKHTVGYNVKRWPAVYQISCAKCKRSVESLEMALCSVENHTGASKVAEKSHTENLIILTSILYVTLKH